MVLFNSISLISRKPFGGLSIAVENFVVRVESDGGVVESSRCVNKAIKALPEADEGRLIFDIYQNRVTTDNGTIESRECSINAINALL